MNLSTKLCRLSSLISLEQGGVYQKVVDTLYVYLQRFAATFPDQKVQYIEVYNNQHDEFADRVVVGHLNIDQKYDFYVVFKWFSVGNKKNPYEEDGSIELFGNLKTQDQNFETSHHQYIDNPIDKMFTRVKSYTNKIFKEFNDLLVEDKS
jgi:hypothetical protein